MYFHKLEVTSDHSDWDANMNLSGHIHLNEVGCICSILNKTLCLSAKKMETLSRKLVPEHTCFSTPYLSCVQVSTQELYIMPRFGCIST